MENTYWLKQTPDKPLFSDLLWSRPQNRTQAGKLLIIGGNLHGFSAPASAYNEALKAGAGTAKVLLPSALQKTVGKVIENGEFAPSTSSGSFAKTALAEWLDHARWAEGTLLAGDFGKNSETSVLIEAFLAKYDGQLTLSQDSVDLSFSNPGQLLERPSTTLVINFNQLQKLASAIGFAPAFTSSMDLIHFVENMHQLSLQHKANLVSYYLDNFIVAVDGKVSTTKDQKDISPWQVKAASAVAVWWLQNPSKPFEALTSSLSSIDI